jgi:hypothetical protein
MPQPVEAGMFDQSATRFHQPLLQAGQRPVLDLPQQHQESCPESFRQSSAQTETEGTKLGEDGEAGDAASYGPKCQLVLCQPDGKRGSEVADRSLMTSTRERSDLD